MCPAVSATAAASAAAAARAWVGAAAAMDRRMGFANQVADKRPGCSQEHWMCQLVKTNCTA
eukprot:4068701-Pyramimonas_sp.AAC.1